MQGLKISILRNIICDNIIIFMYCMLYFHDAWSCPHKDIHLSTTLMACVRTMYVEFRTDKFSTKYYCHWKCIHLSESVS